MGSAGGLRGGLGAVRGGGSADGDCFRVSPQAPSPVSSCKPEAQAGPEVGKEEVWPEVWLVWDDLALRSGNWVR